MDQYILAAAIILLFVKEVREWVYGHQKYGSMQGQIDLLKERDVVKTSQHYKEQAGLAQQAFEDISKEKESLEEVIQDLRTEIERLKAIGASPELVASTTEILSTSEKGLFALGATEKSVRDFRQVLVTILTQEKLEDKYRSG